MRLTPYIIGLIVIGLIAALLSPGTLVEIEYALHYGIPSMYNIEWNGTSMLASILTSNGFKVVEAYTVVDPIILAEVHNPERIIYVYIAPQYPLTSRDVNIVETLMNKYALSLLVCDEANTSNILLSKYGLWVSGRIIYTSYGSPYPLAYFKIGNYSGLFVLNYASSIGYAGHVQVIGETLDGDIVGVMLRKGDDIVAVISDSSIFINLMLSKSTSYMNYSKLVEELFKYLTGGSSPRKTLVIIDLTHYSGPSPRKIAEITGKGYAILHPLVIVQLLSTYTLYVEEVMVRELVENYPIILTYIFITLLSLLVIYNILRP